MVFFKQHLITRYRRQKTLKKEVSFAGIGIHTGKDVQMKFKPAPENSGVYFLRTDLENSPIIKANVKNVQDTNRSTTIGVGNAFIHTVEHVLAAIFSCQIDNVCIEVNGIEPPVANGSSDVFVEMIEEAGILEQMAEKPIVKISEPVHFTQDDISIVAIPADTYRISYTLNYKAPALLQAQFHSVEVNHQNFKKEIAPCRTFSLYKEVSYLMDRGLIKGASLDNAVIIHDEVAFSKNGLFFSNEMARHKILDMIGDLSLVGVEFQAHIIAIKAGHSTNCAFAKEILKSITESQYAT